MKQTSDRAGKVVRCLEGYSAFVPAKLPPNPAVKIDLEMQNLLSLADRKLGRLDGITQILPNPELFVAMYVKKEAVLSAQIEGTQASLADVLNSPMSDKYTDYSADGISEVVNYVKAMNWGLQELEHLPLSLRLIRNIHAVLLKNVRGSAKNPGEFRKTQNWIGAPGCTLETAAFVPPTVPDMNTAMGDLETFIHTQDTIPVLIKIALIHAQFETIHPFLDGNGRMGRLLITFMLCQQEILTKPLLYLSYFFKQNRREYYDRLMAVRTSGDWESWIKFFLQGVALVSDEATESAKQILNIQREYSAKFHEQSRNNSNYLRFFDILFERPIVTRKDAMDMLQVAKATAGNLMEEFCRLGILQDITPDKKRYKKYAFGQYLDILQKGTESAPQKLT